MSVFQGIREGIIDPYEVSYTGEAQAHNISLKSASAPKVTVALFASEVQNCFLPLVKHTVFLLAPAL